MYSFLLVKCLCIIGFRFKFRYLVIFVERGMLVEFENSFSWLWLLIIVGIGVCIGKVVWIMVIFCRIFIYGDFIILKVKYFFVFLLIKIWFNF